MAQESLTNIRRHAHATRVLVALDWSDDRIVLTVRDNGQGFPGALVKAYNGVQATDIQDGLKFLHVDTGLVLPAGTYWLSVQANGGGPDFYSSWFWSRGNAPIGLEAVWKNPGDGWLSGCTDWGRIGACTGVGGWPEWQFALWGGSR